MKYTILVIIEVNNTAFTWLRLEICHHEESEIRREEIENIGYLIMRAYKDLDDNFDEEGSTCIPLQDLESMKERLHEMGVAGEDHMLTPGGSALKKRTTMVNNSVKHLVRLAIDTELNSHLKRLGVT